jgi:hypothetical protein
MKDLFNSINPKRVLSPSAGPTDNTAQVGQIIDRQGFESVTYVIATGSLADADATFTVLLEEGDAANMSDAATVRPPTCSAPPRWPASSSPTTTSASSWATSAASATRA